MRILHVTLTLKGASGVVTFVRELNERLCTRGIESVVETNNDVTKLLNDNWDIIHIHGLWLYQHVVKLSKKNGIPIIWSTHGMTAPWSMHHKWWKKIPAWWLYQKQELKSAAIIHCTTEQEVEWNKSLGISNCFIAPLGTNEDSYQPINKKGDKNEKVLLFVGRIHPVKGLENLIIAWSKLFSSASNIWGSSEYWKLKIVGPDERGHLTKLKNLVNKYRLNESVEFIDPKYGTELSKEYELCDCLILPSFTENFGATVIDAMGHGKPCITSTFTPWKELQERGCGWWVSNEPSILSKAIKEMINSGDDVRHEMGMKGWALVKEKYTWDAVIDKMIEKYNLLIQKS